MKRYLFLVVGLIVSAAAWAQEESKTAGAADRGKTIWLITKGARETYWKAVRSGAVKAGKDFGVKINWQAPLAETMTSKQAQLLDDAVAKQADGIVIAPITETGLADAIGRAAAANIPLVVIDSPAKTDKALAYVASDYAQGGVLAAKRMGEILGGKGRVIMVRNHPDNPATMAREKAFQETLAKEFPDLKLTDNHGRGDRQKATEVTEEMIKAFGDPDGMFTSGEAATFGALGALAGRGLTGKVKVIASDSSPKFVDAVATGSLDSIVTHNPVKMGYEAVKAIVDHWDGKPVEKKIDTGVELATKEKLSDPAIKDMLATEGR